MTGIYLITNLKTNKVYVGQAVRLLERWGEHLRAGQPELYSSKNERDSNSYLHRSMNKYGINNFSFKILELCSREQLNEKEKYWIEKYQSNNNEKGYNLTNGGQDSFALKGENHSQAKLSQKDVNKIKYLLKENKKDYNEILILFPSITKSTLSMINTGKIWVDEKEEYPLRKADFGNKGCKNPRAKYTEEEVMEIRKLYSKGATPTELHKLYSKGSKSAIESIIYGKTYKHLPIYNKKEKRWIK